MTFVMAGPCAMSRRGSQSEARASPPERKKLVDCSSFVLARRPGKPDHRPPEKGRFDAQGPNRGEGAEWRDPSPGRSASGAAARRAGHPRPLGRDGPSPGAGRPAGVPCGNRALRSRGRTTARTSSHAIVARRVDAPALSRTNYEHRQSESLEGTVMSEAGREPSRAEARPVTTVEAIASAYLIEAGGDLAAALRRAIADALADLT